MITVGEFAKAVGGTPIGVPPTTVITGFATDNRETKPGDLFLAIKGANVDGHDFAAAAFKSGAVAALVEKPVEGAVAGVRLRQKRPPEPPPAKLVSPYRRG